MTSSPTVAHHCSARDSPAPPAACTIANPDASAGAGSHAPVKKTAGVLAAVGVACSACLIPGLAVGGAGIFAGAAASGERLLLLAAAAGVLAYATIRRRRSRARMSRASGCGC